MNTNVAPRDPVVALANPGEATSLSPEFRAVHNVVSHPTGVLRHPEDTLFISMTLLHATLLLLFPSIPLIALGLWWNANTISHNFIHLPFFRGSTANARFSLCISLLLGFPQSLWAARHLAHHRDQPFHWKPLRRAWLIEGALVLVLWGLLLMVDWKLFVGVYLPGWALGLALCQLQGRFEHARGAVSHHGRLYNWLFFNDGYHVEHHAEPRRHWTQLPHQPHPDPSHVSRWPAVLRWLEYASLDGLEELVFRSRVLRRFVLHVHQRAMRRALAKIPSPRRVIIVGGGLFPRTALVLRQLAPHAHLVIVDLRADRLERARHWLTRQDTSQNRAPTTPACDSLSSSEEERAGERRAVRNSPLRVRRGEGEPDEASASPTVRFVCGYCTPQNLPTLAGPAELVVVPLALRGCKAAFYGSPPYPHVLVHDWLWNSRGTSTVVSIALLKRLNLVHL